MESFNKQSTQHPAEQTTELSSVQLIGPDGYSITVDIPISEDMPVAGIKPDEIKSQPAPELQPSPEEIEAPSTAFEMPAWKKVLIATGSIGTTYALHRGMDMNTLRIRSGEGVGNNINAASVAWFGLRRSVASRQLKNANGRIDEGHSKLKEYDNSALKHQSAGSASLLSIDQVKRSEDYLEARRRGEQISSREGKQSDSTPRDNLQKHISPEEAERLKSEHRKHQKSALKAASSASNATTYLQDRSGLRANLRVDKILEERRVEESWVRLYGPAIRDADSLKKKIDSGSYTRAQKSAMWKAHKQVAHIHHKEGKIMSRVDHAAKAKDLPGKIIDLRTAHTEKSIVKAQGTSNKAEKKHLKMEQGMLVASVKREQRRLDRARRRASP
ncbi:hypothetical protein BH10PAT3_BH10PAT3_8120 [soil metagenome]